MQPVSLADIYGLLQTGYLSSWSSYNTFLTNNPTAVDPLLKFKQDFESAAQLNCVTEQFKIAFPIFLLLCSNKAYSADFKVRPSSHQVEHGCVIVGK